jgi:signal transduction histidine kinase
MAADCHCHNVQAPYRSWGTSTRHCEPADIAAAAPAPPSTRRDSQRQGIAPQIQDSDPDLQRHMAALHDGPAQLLTLALIQLDTVQAGAGPGASPLLANSRGLIRQALSDIRSLIEDMQHGSVAKLDLAASLRAISGQLQQLAGHNIQLECHMPLPALPEPVTRAILDAARELLMNACKYAGNAHIHVELAALGAGLRLTVQDDGPGYDPAAIALNDGHVGGYGLVCLRDRLGRVGARIELCTGTGHGVWAQIVWPGGRDAATASGVES